MAQVTGHRMPLPLPRRWIADVMHAGRAIPTVTAERVMDMSAVAHARKALLDPPPWVLLFTKAYGLVSARRPELRRAYMPFPIPHLFQADESVASIAIERDYQGEPAVFFGHMRCPENQPLWLMQRHLNRWRTHPVHHIRTFQRLIRYTKMPWPIRRMAWWYTANVSKKWRMSVFGTFGVSVTAAEGAAALNLISPLTTSVNYGLFGADHSLPVRLHFDHRVLDGSPVARALVDLEETMNTDIVAELNSMADDENRGVSPGTISDSEIEAAAA